jgi:hypothetical protein
MAEFVLAIVPLLMTFFSFVQLAKIATARIIVKHGTIVGARAASVIANGHDNTPDQAVGENKDDIRNGVLMAMEPWTGRGSITNVDVTVDDQSSRSDPYGWVTVTVKATYACNVPIGFIACGGKTKTLEESYRMPHQGAIYKPGI